MKEKLKQIILPFILISTGFLVIYCSFYWLVVIQLKFFDFNDKIFGLFIPMGISAFLTWFYFRKKLRLFDTTDKFKEMTLFVSFNLLMLPVLTFLFYLDEETGELTCLKNVDEILNNKPTMYYSIEMSSQHKDKSRLFIGRGYPGRGNEVGIGCYYICPLTNEGDNIHNNNIWIGTMFGEKFSNRLLDDKEKQEKLISQFIDSSAVLYSKYEYKTSFLKRLSNSDVRDDYMKDIQQLSLPHDDDNLIILIECSGDYESRAGASLGWTVFFIISSNVVWVLLTIFVKLKKTKRNTLPKKR